MKVKEDLFTFNMVLTCFLKNKLVANVEIG